MAIKKVICMTGMVVLASSNMVFAESFKVDMKPGLWENKMELVGDAGQKMAAAQKAQMTQAMEEMKKQMASMPAEQRKQMEAVMAQSGMSLKDDGVSFQNGQVNISDKGTVAKSCVTQAEIDRGEFGEIEGDCTSSIKQVKANHFKSTQACKGGDGSSEMEIIFDSPKHYTGKGTVTSVVEGKPQVMQISMVGTWLGSDCGTIKPDK